MSDCLFLYYSLVTYGNLAIVDRLFNFFESISPFFFDISFPFLFFIIGVCKFLVAQPHNILSSKTSFLFFCIFLKVFKRYRWTTISDPFRSWYLLRSLGGRGQTCAPQTLRYRVGGTLYGDPY